MPNSWVEIDWEALAWNHRLIQARIGSETEMLAVVKANAYGHGMVSVARALYALGVHWFGVASVLEGRELREALPDAAILVLGCVLDEEIAGLFEHKLIPAIHSLRFAANLHAKAQRRGIRILVHLKIDTGMGRLGLADTAIGMFLAEVARMPHLHVEGILSHFSSSDEENLKPSRDQLKRFDAAVAQAQAAGLPARWRHLASSNGIFRLPDSHFNMVRAGLFLYGLYPTKQYPHDFNLRPVLSWKSRVCLIKNFQPGQTVSYGRTHTVKKPTKIAVIPVGYADGYNRRLSNTGKVLIHGEFAPVVGRVTMDHLMADVGHIAGVEEGDEVVLIGRQEKNVLRAEDIADWLGTISYEVVCGIGPRVERMLAARNAVPLGQFS